MSTHHKYSPSKLKYLAQCSGYESDPTPGPAAEEGTLLHAATETGDMAGLDDEQRGAVQMCLDYVADLCKDATTPPEREVRLSVLDGATAGTADLLVTVGEVAHVVDYKFGRVGVEDAATNLQGWAYALGAFDKTGLDVVTVHFLSPRRDEVHRAVFTRSEDYGRMADMLAGVVLKADQYHANGEPETALCPDRTTCLWCAARGTCPAVGKLTTEVALRAHGGLVMPTELRPDKMTVDQLAVALDARRILTEWVKAWGDAVGVEAIQRTKDGTQVGDYCLERRSGKREVTDALAASRILAEHFGFAAADLAGCVSISVTNMEKVVAEKAGRGKGKAAKEQLTEVLDAAGLLTTRPPVEYMAKQ